MRRLANPEFLQLPGVCVEHHRLPDGGAGRGRAGVRVVVVLLQLVHIIGQLDYDLVFGLQHVLEHGHMILKGADLCL